MIPTRLIKIRDPEVTQLVLSGAVVTQPTSWSILCGERASLEVQALVCMGTHGELQGLGNHPRAVETMYGQLLSTQTTAPLTVATKKEPQKMNFPSFLFGQE